MSYSHALDGQLAPKLQHALSAFAKPWYRRRAIRVFRDQSSLSATPQLWLTIETAIDVSRFFILLASPGAAESPWVAKELQAFLERASADRVLIALTDGELRWDSDRGDFDWAVTTAFPNLSRRVFALEPLWVDLRAIRRSAALTLRNRDFLDAVARLSSAVRGTALDDLIGEDLLYHRQTVRLAWLVVGVLVMLSAALALAGLYGYRKGQDALGSAAVAKRSAAEARDAALRTQGEFMVSSANLLEPSDPLTAAAVMAELNEDYRSSRARQLLRQLASELPLAILPSFKASPSGDRRRVLTLADDGAARVYDAAMLDAPRSFLGGGKQTLDAALDFRGRRIAIAGDDHTVTVWDVDANRRLSVSAGYEYRYLVVKEVTVALSPDGEYVAFSSGNEARVVRVDGSRAPVILRGHISDIVYLAFSPDGRNVVTASLDRTARVWKLDGTEEEVFRVGSSHPIFASFTRDGRGVLTHDDAGPTHLWSRGGHGAVTFDAGEYNVSTPALSPDGATVAAATKEGVVVLWRTHAPGRPFVLRGHSARIEQVDFSSDGRRLLSASDDGTVRLWHLDTSLSVVLKVSKQSVDYAFFSADGQRIFSDGVGTEAFDTSGGEGEALLLQHAGKVSTVAFDPVGNRVVTASKDGTACVWSVNEPGQPIVLSGHGAPVSTASFGHDGRDVLTAGEDGTVRVWPLDKPKSALVLRVAGHGALAVDRSVDGTRIAVTAKGIVRVWNVAAGDEPRTLSSNQTLESAVFSPDGKKILCIGEQSAFLWRADGDEPPLELTSAGHGRVVEGHFSSDGSRVIGRTAARIGTDAVIVWRTDGMAPPMAQPRRDGPLDGIALSPDGNRMLVLTTVRGSVESLDGKEPPLRLEGGPQGWQRRGVFSSDGSEVALVANDSVAVWRTDEPGPPLRMDGHSDSINDIAISHDGTRIATASDDGTARVWSIDWLSLMKYIRIRIRHLAVCLTDNERIQYLGEDRKVAHERSQACLEPAAPKTVSK